MKKIINSFLLIFLLLPAVSLSRSNDQITNWYVKDFHSKIEIRKDSSLLITESIVADAGNLEGKHGIFRTLPTEITLEKGQKIKNPIKLRSITNFSGEKIPYSEIKSQSDKTITWKIGDAQKTVKGENEYKITYEVQNAIRFQENFDEFYWNLSGNFWQLEIDDFSAEIVFPTEIKKENVEIDYYVGKIGSKNKEGASFHWEGNDLTLTSQKTFLPGEGVTVSLVFPKNFFKPYESSFWEKYSFVMIFIIPLIVFLICFKVWKRYGKDPKLDKTIIPEFEIPDGLSPGEIKLIETSGRFSNDIITASIVNLAVLGVVKIEEIEKKGIFGKKDYKIIVLDKSKLEKASSLEETILENILDGSNEKKLSELKNKFQTKLQKIKKFGLNEVDKKGYVIKSGTILRSVFIVLALIIFFVSFSVLPQNVYLGGGLMLSSVVILIFGFLMLKRTSKGSEINWKIKGFKLYMETAEKHRQQFNEKENIFEKFLPYAIIFGMTKEWIKKMKEIYGEEYFKNYYPIWYGGFAAKGFDADSFLSSLDEVSSSISSNVSSSSGSGGGGFSGGGGGGGGGGGW